MTINERAEMVACLYKMQAEVAVLLARCQTVGALQIGVNVQGAKRLVDEALEDLNDCKPDDPLYKPWVAAVKY
jgi:hypothetical protein